MLARFAECWGSLETSRGGMLEVIGAVGSMLQALLLFYFFALKPMTDLGPTSISRLHFKAMVVFCCQSAAILRHLLYHIGNFHPLFTRHVVGSVGDVGLLLRFPCFSELVCSCNMLMYIHILLAAPGNSFVNPRMSCKLTSSGFGRIILD